MPLPDLPPVRGRLMPTESLAPFTWFRVGGPAEALFLPADAADLQAFLSALPASVPVTVLGVGSNVIVRDGGIPGVVIRLAGAGFGQITPQAGDQIIAAAGALDAMVARGAAAAGLAGLEFLVGIPGSIGGALRMNAGCYGREIKDVLVSARAVDRSGRLVALTHADFGFAYRTTTVPADLIFLDATFQASPLPEVEIRARMEEITQSREASQPIRERTGGSTFKNPPGDSAWKLIDRAGFRGVRRGGAMVSDKHCNFLINTGNATAAEIEALGEEVRSGVQEAFGVELHWEIKRIGTPA